jgi:phenylacetaldehyde dehydrogenase
MLGQLVLEAGFPPGAVAVLTGGPSTGAALVNHSSVDKVSFTGSTSVGRSIIRASAHNLKRLNLELGGKTPAIVLEDANLESAMDEVVHGAFFNSGQCCVAASRLYVQDRIYDHFVDELVHRAQKLVLGAGWDPRADLGPVVSLAQRDRILHFIDEGRKAGATVLSGGHQGANRGYFIEPTVFADTTPAMSIERDEIFGPVVCAIRFSEDDLDEVAQFANNSEYGLAAAIWTRDVSKAHRLASKIKAGSVWVNTDVGGDPAIPHGGFKSSGWGREFGFDSIAAHTEIKTVSIKL